MLDALSETSRRVLFDEAWFAYAHFHPLFVGRHAMGVKRKPGQAATFATQSTHKLLTAFSQASMIHLHECEETVSQAALEEAFMMHTSTSPQYGIIASLDVASRMMEGPQGVALVDDAVHEALTFRRELATLADKSPAEDWRFRLWQPDDIATAEAVDHRDPERWILREGEPWHGYSQLAEGNAMLDPTKVTILTPGVGPDGRLDEHGIPAPLVSRFLDERGIVVEKTGSYSFLVLFSLGITRGKSGTLLSELLEFKRLHDSELPLSEALPRLVAEHSERYGPMTIRDLADELHAAMRSAQMTDLIEAMYSEVPEPVTTPASAYEQLVSGGVEMVGVSELAGRVSAAMIVPYPPGIPVVMPGERFGQADSGLVRYLTASQNSTPASQASRPRFTGSTSSALALIASRASQPRIQPPASSRIWNARNDVVSCQSPDAGGYEQCVGPLEEELPADPEGQHGRQDSADQGKPPQGVETARGERLRHRHDADEQEHEAEGGQDDDGEDTAPSLGSNGGSRAITASSEERRFCVLASIKALLDSWSTHPTRGTVMSGNKNSSSNETSLNNVIAVSFQADSNAYEAMTRLKELDSQGQLGLQAAAVDRPGRERSDHREGRGRRRVPGGDRGWRAGRAADRHHRWPTRCAHRRHDRSPRRLVVRP